MERFVKHFIYAALVLSILLVHDKEYHLLLYIYPVGIVSCHVSFGGLSKQDIVFSNNLSVSEKEISNCHLLIKYTSKGVKINLF